MTSLADHYLNVFTPASGSMILVNQTTTFNVGWLTDEEEVHDISYVLPSANIFDPYGSQDAPLIPGKCSQVILVKGANAAATKTILTNFRGLAGKRGTLQAYHPDGTFKTCMARCLPMEEQEIIKGHFIYTETKVVLTFRRLTNWA